MWTAVDEGRWVIESPGSTSYLLRRGERLHELHVTGARATLHIYDAGQADAAEPLADASHLLTVELAPRERTADVAWKALQEA